MLSYTALSPTPTKHAGQLLWNNMSSLSMRTSGILPLFSYKIILVLHLQICKRCRWSKARLQIYRLPNSNDVFNSCEDSLLGFVQKYKLLFLKHIFDNNKNNGSIFNVNSLYYKKILYSNTLYLLASLRCNYTMYLFNYSLLIFVFFLGE